MLAERMTMSGAALVPELPDSGEIAIETSDLSVPRMAPARTLSSVVAEDNEINALLIRSLLVRIGHRPVVTTDGEQALESWLAADSAGMPYDVVLMDIQMPKLDGTATTKRIRGHETDRGSRRTVILALTANTLVDDRYDCFEAGMDGFLVKPLDRDKLVEALAAIPASRTVAA